jgi:predicted nucleic acid-binding protein
MILLDANLLLEMLIAGRPRQAIVLDWMEENAEPFCITMLTVHLVLHFGLKDSVTLRDIRTFLADYPKIALLPEDYVAALGLLKNRDHENALQLAAAERTNCSAIVTLDLKFAASYKDRLPFVVLGS